MWIEVIAIARSSDTTGWTPRREDRNKQRLYKSTPAGEREKHTCDYMGAGNLLLQFMMAVVSDVRDVCMEEDEERKRPT